MAININWSNREKTNTDLVIRISNLYKKSGNLRTKLTFCHHKKSREIINNWANTYNPLNPKNSFLAGLDCDKLFEEISLLNRKRIVRLQSYGNQIACLTELLNKILKSQKNDTGKH